MSRFGGLSKSPRLGRTIGSPALFTIVYTSVASAIYFSLGVVADNALGLTPFVYLAAGIFFVLAAMTYVEGSSLHQDRGGSTVFARYAFNELVSFIAGWAILLDYVILVAVTALSATNYAAAFYAPLGRGATEIVLAVGIVAYVAVRNIMGFSTTRLSRIALLVMADIGLQLLLIVLGLIYFFEPDTLLSSVQLGTTPGWSDTIFALGVATVVFIGLESASGLAGEVDVDGPGLRRLISSVTASVLVIYVGIAVVALSAQPVVDGKTNLSEPQYLEAPVLGITRAFDQSWLADGLTYIVAIAATMTLVAAANSAMLGLSRMAYSLSRNRQIPASLGRLHPTRSTPVVLICLAAIISAGLIIPEDITLLVGIFAFGSLLSLTIAHFSVTVLRVKEPDAKRPYRMPFSLPFRGAQLPLPAVIGGVLAALAWVSVIVFHEGARYVGFGWMAFGLLLYVGYRSLEGKSLLTRVIVPEAALQGERETVQYGSILVPLTGTPLDDDIIQTAGRLAGESEDFDDSDEGGSTIEALWVIEVPMSLPIDARLPDGQVEAGKTALRRAKAVGEEYLGVEVATAIVRARGTGAAIVDEAKRRGVQAIVLAAEEPSRIRGGALLGGSVPLDNFVGESTKYVLARATCPVILTAPASGDVSVGAAVSAESHPKSAE